MVHAHPAMMGLPLSRMFAFLSLSLMTLLDSPIVISLDQMEHAKNVLQDITLILNVYVKGFLTLAQTSTFN
jgi:hypothetical protein